MEALYYTFNSWWEGKDFESGIDRPDYLDHLPDTLKRKQVEVIIGSRRIGKTTLIKQYIKKLLQGGVSGNDIFYLALDHPSSASLPISGHLKNMRRMFMHGREKRLFLFLDEVQESPNWELELKGVYDMENLKIFCTGSTSALIKAQGGRLTGRQIITTLYPLSFGEFLLFQGQRPSLSEDYKYEKLVEDYLALGGYPEQVLNPSVEYMSNLLDDILARDLIRLYPIKKAFALKDLMRLLASSVGSRTSFNKLAKVLGLSLDTVKEYINYLESAFLVMPVEKWTTSYSEKVYAQKKVYLWDTGIKTLLTGPSDEGSKAENAVFMELQRKRISCGYFAESEKEVDFITGATGKPCPVEVKYVSSFDWNDRRFSGVKLFLRRFPNTKRVLLITRNVETELKLDSRDISVVPLWKFLLSCEAYVSCEQV
ncbi:MAG: ATP-binding protein [Desulfobacterales bacterium]|nr:ATP-binding protein [Desulfobacterales bacterium]